MKDRLISFAKDFHCLAGECPQSCCRGWQIPVDEETYARYLLIPGIRGKAYRGHIVKKEPMRIKKILTVCPFQTYDGLCIHQATGEELLMPIICRNYPKRVIDYGEFAETTLELACPEAARLFLCDVKRQSFVPDPLRRKSVWDVQNDDTDFLHFLMEIRERLIDYVWEEGPLAEKWEAIFAYIYNMHDLFSRDKIEEAKSVELTEDKSSQGIHAVYNRGYAFYPIRVIDRMILDHIDYGALIFRVPRFYKLIKRYIKTFSKLNVNGADVFFTSEIEKMIEKKPELERKYKSYFSYLLQQEFLLSYETYSMIREVMLCILYTELLMLFDLMAFEKEGDISIKRQEEILFLAEHNIRHNPSLTKNLYTIIREEML